MNLEQYNPIQRVIACLSTHSHWYEDNERLIDHVLARFNLSRESEIMLNQYLVSNKKNIWLSAVLLESKRWREMLLTIKYLSKLVPINTMKNYWKDYLNQIDLREAIPSSPTWESIRYLSYIKDKLENLIARSICEYEIMRNFCLTKTDPDYIWWKFDVQVSRVIDAIVKNDNVDNCCGEQSEIVIFYKRPQTGKVCTAVVRPGSEMDATLRAINKGCPYVL